MMPYWHVYGKQNLSNEAYRTTPEAFTAKTQAMVDKYKVREETDAEDPGRASARGQRRLPDRAAVAVVADARARGRQDLPAAPLVDGLAARLLAAAGEHQHPGASRTTSTCSRSRRPGRAPTRSSATSTAASTITRWRAVCTSSRANRGTTMAVNRMFRTCPSTGLVYHEPAEKLIRWNAVAGVVSLLVGGVLALLVIAHALAGGPPAAAGLVLPGADRARARHARVLDHLLRDRGAVLLRLDAAALPARRRRAWAWAAFWLMIIGALVNNVAVFRGDSSVMFTSYAPMGAHPAFYLGLILFAVGALIACFVFFGTLVVAKAEKTYNGSVPLVTFGAVTAAIIAVFTIASGAIILIPTFLWSVGLVDHIDSLMYRTVWWAFGHSSQQINVAAHVSVWYAIAAIVFGAKPMSEKVSRTAFFLYICFLQLASRAPPAGRPRAHVELEDLQHQLRDVPRGAGVDGARADRAGRDRGRAAREGLQQRAVRVAAQGAVGQPVLLGDVHLADRLRLPRRHLRRDDGHRAAQPHHPQHDLRARPLPRDGRHRHHARVHGRSPTS